MNLLCSKYVVEKKGHSCQKGLVFTSFSAVPDTLMDRHLVAFLLWADPGHLKCTLWLLRSHWKVRGHAFSPHFGCLPLSVDWMKLVCLQRINQSVEVCCPFLSWREKGRRGSGVYVVDWNESPQKIKQLSKVGRLLVFWDLVGFRCKHDWGLGKLHPTLQ